jgi:hypothetical protein
VLLARYAAALALTLAVELPVYAVLLAAGWQVPWRRSVTLAAAANLVTHPPLWWLLSPVTSHPAYTWLLLGAEVAACVVEWLLLRAWLRRTDPLLLVPSVAVNTASVLVGIAAGRLIDAVA